jgi:tetratricopeptide (TPR) repeat protein
MFALLLAAALAQDLSPMADAHAFADTVGQDDWGTHWSTFLTSVDDIANPDDGPTPLNHEAAAAIALAVTAVESHGHDVSVVDDAIRAQLVRRMPLRRAYDDQSIEMGATYREALAQAVTSLGRDPRALCIELRAVRARYETGEHDLALRVLSDLQSGYSHPYDVAVVQHLRGQLLLKKGDAAAALPLLLAARDVYDPAAKRVQRAPTLDRTLLWDDLARTYDALGEEKLAKKARKKWKKAVKLGPSDSLWFADQERLTIVLEEPFQGTCWDGDAWWRQVREGER